MAGRILIACDGVTARIALKAHLSAMAYNVTLAYTPDEVFAALLGGEIDAVMMSGELGGVPVAPIVDEIRSRKDGDTLPLIILEAEVTRDVRLQLLEAGADAVMTLAPSRQVLTSRLRNLLRRSTEEKDLARDLAQSEVMSFAEFPAQGCLSPGRISIVAPEPKSGVLLRQALSTRLRGEINAVAQGQALTEIGRAPPPDAIVIVQDTENPGKASQILADFRCHRDTKRTVAILLKPDGNSQETSRLLDLDATDVICGTLDVEEVALIIRRELRRKAVSDQKRATLRRSLNMAVRDPLTGLYNRRYALAQLGSILQSSNANGEQFAVMVLDLDWFKIINDTHGHAAGDAVLIEVARRLTNRLRHEDFVARIGGEEFVAVVRNCDSDVAQVTAERLRRAVADAPVMFDGFSISLTTSIGLVVRSGADDVVDPAEFVERADRSLYDAKSAGRNQVTLYDSAA